MTDLRTDPAEFFERLETYTLDSVFEDYGNFAEPREDGATHFHGNFADLSARFDFVLEGEPAQQAELTIRRHQRTERYLAEKLRRRARVVQRWAHQQRDKWGGTSSTGQMVLRMVDRGELEQAEKVMRQAS